MTMLFDFGNIHSIYCLTSFFLAIGLIIASLEDLKVFEVFSDTGLLSWKVSRLISKNFCRGAVAKIANLVLNEHSFKLLLYLKLITACVLLGCSFMNVVLFPVFLILFITHSLIFLRTPYSLDGAYQMAIVILMAFTIGSGFGVQSTISKLSIFYVAAQLILAYFISGIAKLMSPIWRKSYAMNLVFSTNMYGHPLIYRAVSQSKLIAYLSSWAVILFESFFFLILFSNEQVAVYLLGIGFLFHLGNAVFMGLNDFLFAFLASYPSVLYLLDKKTTFF